MSAFLQVASNGSRQSGEDPAVPIPGVASAGRGHMLHCRRLISPHLFPRRGRFGSLAPDVDASECDR